MAQCSWETLFQTTGREVLVVSSEDLCRCHAVFRTVDQPFILRGLLESSVELAHPVYMCFLDWGKANIYFPWIVLWRTLQEYGAPTLQLQTIQPMNDQCENYS